MTKKKTLLILLLLVVGAGLRPGHDASARGSWKWLFSMKMDKPGTSMLMPSGIFFDSGRERYYVTDPVRNSLHSFDKEGTYLKTLNPGNRLQVPFAMARDDQGVFWVVEKGRNSLSKIDLKAKEIVTNQLEYQGRTVYPDRMAIDQQKFYVLDKFSGDILVFDRDLKNIGLIGCDSCSGGFVDFVIRADEIWALEKSERAVYRFAGDGSLLKKVELEGELAFPLALEIGPAGLIYVLDSHRGRVVVFDRAGRFKYSFLSKGHNMGRLYYPKDLLFDPWDRLCVVDAGNGRVEVFGR